MIDVYTLDTHFFSARGHRLRVEDLLRPLLVERGIPGNAEIIKNKYGKPYLRDYPEVHFNGSHSGDYILCAFSESPVGIDVQAMDRSKNIRAIGRRFMTENEASLLESLGGNTEEAHEAFYRLWAQKESYMKYIGLGFGLPLNCFEIKEAEGSVRVWRENAAVPGVFLSRADFHGDYELWICGEENEIRLLTRSPEMFDTMTERGKR